jgi:hypothetical protein
MSESHRAVRPRGFAAFNAASDEIIAGNRHALMRGQNFWVEWVGSAVAGDPTHLRSDAESLLITSQTALQLVSHERSETVDVMRHSVCILPPGAYSVAMTEPGSFVSITSQRGDLTGRNVLNDAAYTNPDPRIEATGRPFRRLQPLTAPQVLAISAVQASSEKPRLKMIQTETLSVNIVEYEGARDSSSLSPHSHDSFEQGSLALDGQFVHHLRVPWKADAGLWREDEHLAAASPSLLVVPVEMIHTSEGVGTGKHFLIDIFSPPRRDFISKGWVFNAHEYEALT